MNGKEHGPQNYSRLIHCMDARRFDVTLGIEIPWWESRLDGYCPYMHVLLCMGCGLCAPHYPTMDVLSCASDNASDIEQTHWQTTYECGMDYCELLYCTVISLGRHCKLQSLVVF